MRTTASAARRPRNWPLAPLRRHARQKGEAHHEEPSKTRTSNRTRPPSRPNPIADRPPTHIPALFYLFFRRALSSRAFRWGKKVEKR